MYKSSFLSPSSVLLYSFAWLLLGASFFAQATGTPLALSKGGELLKQAQETGERKYLRQAQKQFRIAEQKIGPHPLVHAYIAAGLVEQTEHENQKVERQHQFSQALVRLDNALTSLKAYESDIIVLMKTKWLVADTWVRLPSHINRLDDGRALIDEVTENKLFSVMPEPFRMSVYMTGAVYADKQGNMADYRRFLGKVVATVPQTSMGKEAQILLSESH